MKTSRKDVKIDKRDMPVFNSTSLGYSRATLKKGDHFIYKERYTDGTHGFRLAKSHGRVKPVVSLENEPVKWYILAQAASDGMTFTYERWIEPDNVTEVIPKDRVNSNIEAFFVEKEETCM